MKTILIIEDDAKVATALGLRLEQSGLRALVAADAVVGRSLAVRHRPDLIVLDIALPGGDGLELAEQFRRLPETRDTPIIFITARKDFGLRRRAMKLGASGFLEKPYDAEELLALADHAMARRDLMKGDEAWAKLSEGPRSARRILVVEDDPKIALGLALRLRAAGYETTVAHDALNGIGAAVKTKPDLLLLDISMPAGSGFAVVEKVRDLFPFPPPIIFLSASQRPDFRRRACELGAAAFFEKPYDAAALVAAIQRTFRGQPVTVRS